MSIEHRLTNRLFLLFSAFSCPFVLYCFTPTVSSSPSRSHITEQSKKTKYDKKIKQQQKTRESLAKIQTKQSTKNITKQEQTNNSCPVYYTLIFQQF